MKGGRREERQRGGREGGEGKKKEGIEEKEGSRAKGR